MTGAAGWSSPTFSGEAPCVAWEQQATGEAYEIAASCLVGNAWTAPSGAAAALDIASMTAGDSYRPSLAASVPGALLLGWVERAPGGGVQNTVAVAMLDGGGWDDSTSGSAWDALTTGPNNGAAARRFSSRAADGRRSTTPSTSERATPSRQTLAW